MDEDSIGFSAKGPVSAWNKRIGVDYPGVFKALIKATIAYATGNAPAGLSATVDGYFAFKLEDRPLPPAELAWLLIRRALAHAMARLSVEALAGRAFLGKESDTLIAALDQGLDSVEIWIDPTFFDRPADMPMVEAVRTQFEEWLREYVELDAAKAASVQRRLGAYFTFALRREWAEQSETYASIDAEIRKLETPFAKATARERAWLRNAAYLERQIHEPVFDETFGLAQIYVPLRAWYLEGPASSRERGRYREATSERRRVVDLEHHLDAWFGSDNKKDAIRVICGGPGSGKTSFAKIWAAKLAQAEHRVLFVPLHRLGLDDERPNVQEALWGFLRDLNVLPADPLDSSDGERRLLILFDGLDELAMHGRAGLELARNFVEAVEQKLSLLNDRSDRFVQVAFGGRDIAVEGVRIPERTILHVMPYNVEGCKLESPKHGRLPEIGAISNSSDVELYGRAAAENELSFPPQRYPFPIALGILPRMPKGATNTIRTAAEYSCHLWWKKFGEATGLDYEGIPASLLENDLADLLAQPILNYLLALSYRRGKLDFSTVPNLNSIYRDLLDSVYERRWGSAPHPTTKFLSPGEFDQLLDELGLATWHGSGRTISETELEEACKRAGLEEQLLGFKEGARAGAIGLLAAFYFRQSSKIHGERSFEFTHKTFREYLTSRRIVRSVSDIHEDRSLNRRNRQRGRTEEEALTKWVEVTGPTALDRDLVAFVGREIALQNHKSVDEWRTSFAELFNDQLRYGLPIQNARLSSFADMCRQARNAEEALLVTHFCCASFVQKRSDFTWPSPVALRDMLARLKQENHGDLASFCLGWLDAGGGHRAANLQRIDLSSANLAYANLQGANLEGAYLNRANLAFVNLKKANLRAANLGWCNLRGTNLRQTTLQQAYLGWANLEGADLQGANLDRANLDWANLVGAKGLIDALTHVGSCWRAKIERKWVARLGLNVEALALDVADDLDDD